MRIAATSEEAHVILRAMLEVASTSTTPSPADQTSVAAAARYIFRIEPPPDLTPFSPSDTARALSGKPDLAKEAVSFATVMAFIDGKLDNAKMQAVLRLANALGVKEDFVEDITKLAQGHLKDATAHMIRANLESITGRPWQTADIMPWLMPYKKNPDIALAMRFRTLSSLPHDTFGHAFATFYLANKYAFPGEESALNISFAVPHDSTHVLAAYDTSPRGELMASTLTAAMHRSEAMSGHVLPVILSWHLGIPLNEVAGAAKGALDPQEFWRAWARGEATKVDLFGNEWDFWAATKKTIGQVRAEVGL
jgi:tellurite resistance protein